MGSRLFFPSFPFSISSSLVAPPPVPGVQPGVSYDRVCCVREFNLKRIFVRPQRVMTY